jgi:hypothetical protein
MQAEKAKYDAKRMLAYNNFYINVIVRLLLSNLNSNPGSLVWLKHMAEARSVYARHAATAAAMVAVPAQHCCLSVRV